MSLYQRRGKRLLDVIAAAALLVCASPVMAFVALCVWLTLGRPILFRQRRAGHRGRPFWLYKFRTMSEVRNARVPVAPDAERITRLGRWLRATSLDELPQLWNVLRGDMSLIGPRPLLPEYLPLYSRQEMRRHDVPPGLTGWAQINGRNGIPWKRKFELDVEYVDRLSWKLDVQIIVATVWCVLGRQGVSAADHATMPPFTGCSPGMQESRAA